MVGLLCLLVLSFGVWAAPIEEDVFLLELNDALAKDMTEIGDKVKYELTTAERNEDLLARHSAKDFLNFHMKELKKSKSGNRKPGKELSQRLPSSKVCHPTFACPSLLMSNSWPPFKFPTIPTLKPFPTWAPLTIPTIPPLKPFPTWAPLTIPTLPPWKPLTHAAWPNLVSYSPLIAAKPPVNDFESNHNIWNKFFPQMSHQNQPAVKSSFVHPAWNLPTAVPLNMSLPSMDQFSYNWVFPTYPPINSLPLPCYSGRPASQWSTFRPCPFADQYAHMHSSSPSLLKNFYQQGKVHLNNMMVGDGGLKLDVEQVNGESSQAVHINVTSFAIDGNKTVHLMVPNQQHSATQIFEVGNTKNLYNLTIVILNNCQESNLRVQCADKAAINLVPANQDNLGNLTGSNDNDHEIIKWVSSFLQEAAEVEDSKSPLSLTEFVRLKGQIFNKNEVNQGNVLKDIKSLLFGESTFFPGELSWMTRAQPDTDLSPPEVNGSSGLSTNGSSTIPSKDIEPGSIVSVPGSVGVEDSQSAVSALTETSEPVTSTVSGV